MNLLQGWKVGEYHFDILQFWLRQEYVVDHNYIYEYHRSLAFNITLAKETNQLEEG